MKNLMGDRRHSESRGLVPDKTERRGQGGINNTSKVKSLDRKKKSYEELSYPYSNSKVDRQIKNSVLL